MDVRLLRADRQRIAEQFRSTFTCLGILRGQLIRASNGRGSSAPDSAMEEESGVARKLGEKLLALDASILELQTRNPVSHEALCFQRRSTFDSALRLRTRIRAMFEAKFRAVLWIARPTSEPRSKAR